MRPALIAVPPPTIPLAAAVLCLACETVHQGSICPKCGNRFGWLLARWIGQLNDEERACGTVAA